MVVVEIIIRNEPSGRYIFRQKKCVAPTELTHLFCHLVTNITPHEAKLFHFIEILLAPSERNIGSSRNNNKK